MGLGWKSKLLVVLFLGTRAFAATDGLPPMKRPYPETLAGWAAFTVGLDASKKTLKWAPTALPYDLNNALFADYAIKLRTVWVPPGHKAPYQARGVFDFPVGTVFSKTFYFPKDGKVPTDHASYETVAAVTEDGLPLENKRLIETRILVRTETGWVGLPYLWNDEQTEATLHIEGNRVNVDILVHDKKSTISYVVPNMNQCLTCHMNYARQTMTPIGPQANHLNKIFAYPPAPENQLAKWTKSGFLSGVPTDTKKIPKEAVWNDDATGDINARARAYLDINCAHCHSTNGGARTSGLYLSQEITSRETLGVMKQPVAPGPGAGNLYYDVVPKFPDKSILYFRMASVVPKVLMPELGRTQVDEEGLALIREWIAHLE